MPELVAEGVNLVIYGMGTVFVFLTLLVIATTIMSRLVLHFEGAKVVHDTPGRRKQAAIAAAIHRYRQDH